jgi:hypothetical protein
MGESSKLAFCPFFARAIHFTGGDPFFIDNPTSNQCALITSAHSPCVMELAKATPNWRECHRNPAVREREPQGCGSTEAVS